MKCINCKHFEQHKNETYNYGKCHNVFVREDEDDVAVEGDCPINGIMATCDEYRGMLLVGKEFGCIHFKEIEK